MASLDAPVKVGLTTLVLMVQRSREMGSAESNGLTKDSSASVMGDTEDPVSERKSKTLETTHFQEVFLANSQGKGVKSKSPDAGGKADSSQNSCTEMMEGWSSVPSTCIRAQPTYIKVEVLGVAH